MRPPFLGPVEGVSLGTGLPVPPVAPPWVLASELFVLNDADAFLVYSPFTKGVARVNGGLVAAIREMQAGRRTAETLPSEVVESLVDAGVLVTRDDPAAHPPQFARKDAFDPSGLTLFLTTKCSLACSYCYASANERPRTMTWDIAKAGIDWMFRHAARTGKREVTLTLHGGGEVTTARDVFERSVEYARVEGARAGIRVLVGAGLNGVIAGPFLEWVIANLDGATVSVDGLPEVHNRHRPLLNGQGSFEIVASALRRMDEAHFNYAIRATVTSDSMAVLPESVDYLFESFGAALIHLEPVFPVGRAATNHRDAPSPMAFVEAFRAARRRARARGRDVRYSGARFGVITNKFCQVSDDLLALTPEGFVSSCYEIGDETDARAETFMYGRLNKQTGELDLDAKKLWRLRTLTVEHKSSCDHCFCKWSCGGECSAKLAAAGDAWDAGDSPRCVANRELTLDQIRDSIDPETATTRPSDRGDSV